MSAAERVAARGYQYRLILEYPVPPEARDSFNALWREKRDDVYTPNLSLNGRVLYGSVTTRPIMDLEARGYATQADYRAVSAALQAENKIMQELFKV
ncbi:MAG: hypothetical protein OXG68_02235 [Chloroflexi bacterium]|nr:hypothetical protein [Chloroflexota bacterium]